EGVRMSQQDFDRAAAQQILAAIRYAFESGNPEILDAFRHPSQPKHDYVPSFIRNGRQISSFRIEKYQQPDWEIFQSKDLYPPPAFVIWVELQRTERWLPTTLFFACGESANGYCFSFY